ncbi:Structural maintenance of chromosomes protein 3 [Marasmius sp. AFHP31]|nr:Structural maintenance of chromosomes protein 3 [Marasmius sp. AFHP31]
MDKIAELAGVHSPLYRSFDVTDQKFNIAPRKKEPDASPSNHAAQPKNPRSLFPTRSYTILKLSIKSSICRVTESTLITLDGAGDRKGALTGGYHDIRRSRKGA